jgi:multiple sugar transport system ATP-binding protein
MRTEIKKVHQTVRTTTVYVTHDQVEAMTLADRVVVMNHGIIEQVGPPQELYHHPATRFVAGFIGSPAMNFIPARIEGANNALSVRLSDAISLPIPAQRLDRYGPYKDKKMIFGIRPEHLTETHEGSKANMAPLTALVDVTEPMGMETMVHFFIEGAPVCARVDPTVRAERSEGARQPATRSGASAPPPCSPVTA